MNSRYTVTGSASTGQAYLIEYHRNVVVNSGPYEVMAHQARLLNAIEMGKL